MSGDVHVRFCERLGVRLPRATHRNVYVRSKAAGERVLASLERWLAQRLRLRVNRDKSGVARPWTRKFLGYSVTWDRAARLRVSPAAVTRLKTKLRDLLRQGRGRRLAAVVADLNLATRGWVGYFRLAEVKATFEELDKWLRRKLRCDVATVEASTDSASRTSSARSRRGPRVRIRFQRPRAVVECRREPHACGRAHRCVAAPGALELAR